MKINIENAIREHELAIDSVVCASDTIYKITKAMVKCLRNGGKVLWFGNGGSAAEAQHMAAELMVRYEINRQPLASISLTTDTSLLTAHSNDYDFASVFSRQIKALAKAGDMVVGMSTSGTSANVVNGLKQAKQQNCISVALIGKEITAISEVVDLCIQVNSTKTARVQEAHTFINHLICEGLDLEFGKSIK